MELNEFKSFVETGLEGVQKKALDAVENARTEAKAYYEQLKTQGVDANEAKQLCERMMKRLDAVEANYSRPSGGQFGQKSIGEMLTESDALKELARQLKPGGSFNRGSSASLPLKSFAEFAEFIPGLDLKTTITSSTVGLSTPGILNAERIPGIVKPGVRRIRVRDLMPRLTTSSAQIDFVKENVFTNASSPTAETISKPESALTFVIDSVGVKTIATWIPMAKQVMDDFAALEGYVNTRLLEGLKNTEDYELVAGDGTGNHLSGLSTEATAYDTARNVTSDTRLDKLNHAISQIEDALQVADGIILHPRDWRTIQLIKTEEGGANKGSYLLGGPAGDSMPMLWGVPVATTTAVTAGTFYVGSFQQYCIVWDRMDARIDISTEHADYFIRNMVAVRAEERIAFTVGRADAVVYGAF